MRNIEKALVLKIEVNPADKLPEKYHEFLDIFLKKEANQLPPHYSYNHKISLRLGSSLLYQQIYKISQFEL